uniref:Uncharacterized protein n=1 Tax=Eucampia antarctica TaxID=49252 RepID=A0A7S2R5I2_9STRA
MTSLLKADQGLIVFAARWRKPDEERAFFETMEKSGFEFVLVKDYLSQQSSIAISEDEKNEEAVIEIFENDLSWKEFGLESSEKSKKYFSEMKVNVAGTMIPLGEIQENDIEEMDEDDFDTYEMRYIQMYVGYKAQ